ncbi:MAG: hypothetical protein Q8T09_00155 [Candidatus Melainabacteria bacterium]|nr:hypothetical protein [Candidatus Melainabacteria bacterium]
MTKFIKFPVLDAAAEVNTSLNADWLWVNQPGEGLKVYRLDGEMYHRQLVIPTIVDGITAAFRHDQFRGTSEIAIVGEDKVYRFGLTTGERLADVNIVAATAVAYSSDGEKLIIGNSAGCIAVLDLYSQQLNTQKPLTAAVSKIMPSTFGDSLSLTVTTDDNNLWILIEDGSRLIVESSTLPEDYLPIVLMANSRVAPVMALANSTGLLYVTNFAQGVSEGLEFNDPIVDLTVAPNGVELVCCFNDSIEIVHLDCLDQGDFSELLLQPYSRRIFAARYHNDELRIVYE